jgi:hypothetical protein
MLPAVVAVLEAVHETAFVAAVVATPGARTGAEKERVGTRVTRFGVQKVSLSWLSAVLRLLIALAHVGHSHSTAAVDDAMPVHNTSLAMCSKSLQELQIVALSQDTLYNTAMKECESQSIIKWDYNSFVGQLPNMDVFDLPRNVRMACVCVQFMCIVPTPHLSPLIDNFKSDMSIHMCVRGSHAYQRLVLAKTPFTDTSVIHKDFHFMPDQQQVEIVSRYQIKLIWPLSMFATRINAGIDRIIERSSQTFVSILCMSSAFYAQL